MTRMGCRCRRRLPGDGAHAAAHACSWTDTDPGTSQTANPDARSAAQAHAAVDTHTNTYWGPMFASTPAFGMVERASPANSQHPL